MKYVLPKCEKSSFIGIVHSAPPTGWVGLGPDRLTNTRCRGHFEWERVVLRRGWRFLLGIKHPPQARKYPVKRNLSCLAALRKRPGWACAHDTCISSMSMDVMCTGTLAWAVVATVRRGLVLMRVPLTRGRQLATSVMWTPTGSITTACCFPTA